jgi:hypothetical protein
MLNLILVNFNRGQDLPPSATHVGPGGVELVLVEDEVDVVDDEVDVAEDALDIVDENVDIIDEDVDVEEARDEEVDPKLE